MKWKRIASGEYLREDGRVKIVRVDEGDFSRTVWEAWDMNQDGTFGNKRGFDYRTLWQAKEDNDA